VAPTTGAGVGAPLAGNAARRLPSRSAGRTQPGRVRAAIVPGSYRAREAAPDCGWSIASAPFHWACARLNNSVIRGTNTVSGKFKRNDVMEALMRTYIVAIAAAALFAIPTAAFSESGHHRYYNRYEGLYDRYESERCRESRAACTHKEKLGEQVMGNCRRFRELCD
jgi:hypothetical protein